MPDLATVTREMGRVGWWGRVSVLRLVPRSADDPLGGATSDEVESPSTRADERMKVIDADYYRLANPARTDEVA